ncbi:MAG: DNA topoisomerase IV subunit A, partial [Desulfobulbaceae bacterium]|nr:DNA topoisomerase IV subunit A [Desulfobulbaceae bacterium]
SEVEVRKVALSNLTFGYDPESGFLGTQTKGEGEFSFACSEYDKILLIFKNGLYKVISVTDKLFVGHDVIWCGKAGGKIVFNIIYKDGEQNLSFVKRFKSPKFILEKEYRLFEEHKKSEIQYLSTKDEGAIRINFVPNKRARSNSTEFAFNEFLIKGVGAIGKRISNRTVRRITEIAAKSGPQEVDPPQRSLFEADKKEGPEST